MELWEAIRWIHVVAMAFFVGGQIFLAAAVVPALRGSEDREPVRAIARRFGLGSLVAVGVLLATGSAMASHYDEWGDGTLQVKLALVTVVGLLIAGHMRRPQAHVLEGLTFLLSLVIVWLGLAIAHGF